MDINKHFKCQTFKWFFNSNISILNYFRFLFIGWLWMHKSFSWIQKFSSNLYMLARSLTRSHTHAHLLSLAQSLAPTRSLAHSHTHAHSLPLAQSLAPACSITRSRLLNHSLPLAQSLTPTLTLTCSRSLTHSLPHSRSLLCLLTRSHTHSLTPLACSLGPGYFDHECCFSMQWSSTCSQLN
jgi:hypothetical protein